MEVGGGRGLIGRLYGGLFALGIAVFAALVAGGAYQAYDAYGRPPLRFHMDEINDSLEQGALGPGLRQLRAAAAVDVENRYSHLSLAHRIARQIRDEETEAWALRQLLRYHPRNDRMRMRLEELTGGER